MCDKIKFGTDGWRAIIGKDFNLGNVEAVAQAIADYLIQAQEPSAQALKVVIGYDTRRLSREAARGISRVLAANKIKVVLSHRPLPTPAISYTVGLRRCNLGIMVTASHNPARFNGIKIKSSFGQPAEVATTEKIEQLIGRHQPAKVTLSEAQKKGVFEISDLVAGYLKFLQTYLDKTLLRKGRLKILVDSMHGTADSYIAKILKNTPVEVTTIHGDADPLFGGIKPEPIQACLKDAASLMKAKRFDLGLATDGDADRIAALDAQGRFISPQQIMAVLLLYLIQHRRLKGSVVKTIAGTSLLDKIAKKYKLKLYETPIGFKHISRLMQTKDILIGGEEAGGIGFKNYLPERDGILAGLLLLEALLARNKSFTALLRALEQEFGRHFYLRRDLHCSLAQKDSLKTSLAKLKLRKTFFRTRIAQIKDYDGLKFYLIDGSWILWRLSGTEPVLRIYAESDSLAKTKRLIAQGKKILKFQ